MLLSIASLSLLWATSTGAEAVVQTARAKAAAADLIVRWISYEEIGSKGHHVMLQGWHLMTPKRVLFVGSAWKLGPVVFYRVEPEDGDYQRDRARGLIWVQSCGVIADRLRTVEDVEGQFADYESSEDFERLGMELVARRPELQLEGAMFRFLCASYHELAPCGIRSATVWSAFDIRTYQALSLGDAVQLRCTDHGVTFRFLFKNEIITEHRQEYGHGTRIWRFVERFRLPSPSADGGTPIG